MPVSGPDSAHGLKPGDMIGGHPDPAIRRAERAVVRGLAAEYGKGKQVQMTLPDRIEIGVGGVVVTIRVEVGA